MSGVVLQALNILNSEDILFFRTYTIEGRKVFERDKAFRTIWEGGILRGCSLKIRCQISVDSGGHLLYNGRRFSRSSWSWRPPKFIRQQGRLAKESTDPRNNHPEIVVYTMKGEALLLDACPCGGELLMDNNENLYCSKCKIIYE